MVDVVDGEVKALQAANDSLVNNSTPPTTTTSRTGPTSTRDEGTADLKNGSGGSGRWGNEVLASQLVDEASHLLTAGVGTILVVTVRERWVC